MGVGQETVLDTKTKQVTELSTEAALVLVVLVVSRLDSRHSQISEALQIHETETNSQSTF